MCLPHGPSAQSGAQRASFCAEMVTAAGPALRAGGGGWKNGLRPLCRAGGAQHPHGIFTSWWSLICLCHWRGEAKTTPSPGGTSPGGWVCETSSHRTCLTIGIAVHRQFPGGMCLSLWNPPAVLLLEKNKFIFPQLWNTCLPSENLLLGYFGSFRKIDPMTLMIWSIFLTK